MTVVETIKGLNAKEKVSFKIHLTYSIMQGIILGSFMLNEFIFISDMNGSKMNLSVLLQLAVVVLLLSTFINELMRRVRFPLKTIRKLAILTHAPLVLLYFFPQSAAEYTRMHHLVFLGIFFLFYLNDMIVMPTLNQILKNNYSHQNFGKLYSYASSVNKIVILFVAFGFASFLDYDNFAFTKVYPILALIGIASVHLLSRIQNLENKVSEIRQKFWKSVLISFKINVEILKSNRPFLNFQIGFMLYGFAWMISAAVITIYFKEVFEMNHQTFSFYKNVFYNILAIVLLPFFGKLIGNIDPRKFGVITFGSFLIFLFVLGIADLFPQHIEFHGIQLYPILLVAYLFYSVFAATMALLWYIGSAYFCKQEEVADYQSVHLVLTGLRGIFGFQLGILFYQSLGFRFTFMLSVALLASAIAVLIWSQSKQKLVIQRKI